MCKVNRVNRWYYRCLDCLTISAADAKCSNAKCGGCGGAVEIMGQVMGMRLGDVSHQCACDGRCTGATGPSCDCSCGGENHGSGKVVRILLDLGPVPVLEVMDAEASMARATEYREALATLEAYMANTRAPFYCYAYRAVFAAKKLRTHAARMSKLRACANKCLGVAVA